MSKKITITVEVDLDLRERFKKICKINDSTSSQEIRKYMKTYVSKNSHLALHV